MTLSIYVTIQAFHKNIKTYGKLQEMFIPGSPYTKRTYLFIFISPHTP